jgi:ADP-heptose:LPS heptosyltransferase
VSKAACPDAKLVFIGSASNLRLASRITLIDEAIPLTHRGVLANLSLIARLRRERFDLAVAYHPDTTLAAIVGLPGATYRVCYWCAIGSEASDR